MKSFGNGDGFSLRKTMIIQNIWVNERRLGEEKMKCLHVRHSLRPHTHIIESMNVEERQVRFRKDPTKCAIHKHVNKRRQIHKSRIRLFLNNFDTRGARGREVRGMAENKRWKVKRTARKSHFIKSVGCT